LHTDTKDMQMFGTICMRCKFIKKTRYVYSKYPNGLVNVKISYQQMSNLQKSTWF